MIDINEYSPTFLQPSYVTEVDEGRLYQEIIRVEATDRDCTPLFGDVCKYEILTSDQPFTIDNEGSIRNTEPLSHKVSHNHILSVVAYDCAMKQSAPVMVNIRVRRVCEARLMSIPERIDYTANSLESVSLFPKIRLELCDMQCKGDDLVIEASVTLKVRAFIIYHNSDSKYKTLRGRFGHYMLAQFRLETFFASFLKIRRKSLQNDFYSPIWRLETFFTVFYKYVKKVSKTILYSLIFQKPAPNNLPLIILLIFSLNFQII